MLKVLSRQWLFHGFVVLCVGFAPFVCELLYRGPTTTWVLDIISALKRIILLGLKYFFYGLPVLGLCLGWCFLLHGSAGQFNAHWTLVTVFCLLRFWSSVLSTERKCLSRQFQRLVRKA